MQYNIKQYNIKMKFIKINKKFTHAHTFYTHHLGKKLKAQRYGSFTILDKVDNNAFRIELPLYV